MEDNPDDEELTLRGLKRSALAGPVVVLRNGQEARIWMEGAVRPPSLFILDHKLAGAKGAEMIESLKRYPCLARAPVAIVSSAVTPELESRYKAAGAVRVLEKPMELSAYVAAIRDLAEYVLAVA